MHLFLRTRLIFDCSLHLCECYVHVHICTYFLFKCKIVHLEMETSEIAQILR